MNIYSRKNPITPRMDKLTLFLNIGLLGVFSSPHILEEARNVSVNKEEKPVLNFLIQSEDFILESIRRSVLHKCSCEGDEVLLSNNTCISSPTMVAIQHPLTYDPILFNTTEFNIVWKEKLECEQGFFKTQSNDFLLKPYGYLFDYGMQDVFDKDSYCIDHVLDEDGEINWIAEVCIPVPLLNACCRQGHILSNGNECVPHYNTKLTPSVIYNGNSLIPIEYLGEVITDEIVCSEGDLYDVELNGDDAVLHYKPYDFPQLVYINNYMERTQVSEYCIGMRMINDTFQYFGRFCYVDPCVKSTCVRKCCPPDMHLYNGSCTYNDSPQDSLELEFYTKSSLNKLEENPKNLHTLHGQLLHCTEDQGLSAIQLDPQVSPSDEFYLTNDGQLHVPVYRDGGICAIADDTTFGKADFSVTRYCIDMHETDDRALHPTAIICFQKSQDPGCSPNSYDVLQNDSFIEALTIEERVKTSTVHKCKCGANEILSADNKCLPYNTEVQILHPLTLEPTNVHTSSFGNIFTRELNCNGGFHETTDRFIIQPSGHLYYYELEVDIVITDYCIEHILSDKDGGGVRVRAELCLPDPPIPTCCPHGQILDEDGSCLNTSLEIEFMPPIHYKGKSLDNTHYGAVVHEAVTCSHHESIIENKVDGRNAILDYYPYYPPKLNYYTRYMERAEARPYCLGAKIIGGSVRYFSRSCHMDPCDNSTCVRKCCPPDMHMNGGCKKNNGDDENLNLTFFDVENMHRKVEFPDNLYMIYNKKCKNRVVKLDPYHRPEDAFKLLNNGHLYVVNEVDFGTYRRREDTIPKRKDYTIDKYCLDTSVNQYGEISQIALLCV